MLLNEKCLINSTLLPLAIVEDSISTKVGPLEDGVKYSSRSLVFGDLFVSTINCH